MNRNNEFNLTQWRYVFYFIVMIVILFHFFYYPKEASMVKTQVEKIKDIDHQLNKTDLTSIETNYQYDFKKEVTVNQMEQLIEKQQKEHEALHFKDKEDTLNLIFKTHNVILVLFITLLLVIYMTSFIDDNDYKQNDKQRSMKYMSNIGYTLLMNKDEENNSI